MSVYAVGDIQGCYKPLRRLLDKVEFDPVKDILWCAGDMVSRGPDSLAVIRYLKSLGDACITVLGNNEIQLLTMATGKKHHKQDSLNDIIAAKDCDDLMHWLRNRPLLYHDPLLNWCMVHAGLHPLWRLKKVKRYADRVEKQLRGDGWQSFLKHIDEHKMPTVCPEGKGFKRNLYTLSVLTQARYCTQEGHFDWVTRSKNINSEDSKPWFSHSQLKWKADSRVVFGHWAARGLVADQPHVLGLDTGCAWGGMLSMARLDNDKRRIVAEPC